VTSALDRVGQRAAAVPSPGRVGQATAVEQARAVAEVQAAVMVAQQVPRNLDLATAQMQDTCGRKELADRAFFAFPRAGEQVAGPSIHLARELARCFGNVQYGINELRRDDEAHQSEMLAWAWDVQNNTRSTTTFIVPHARDTRTRGRVDLTELRDVYENNANHGARRLREMIFAILPAWFTAEAQAICQATLETADERPLAEQVKEAVDAFAQGPKVTEEQLVKRVGKPAKDWNAADVAQLRVLYQSLRQRTTTVEEAFGEPDTAVKAEELTGGAPKGPKATQGQMGRIHALLKDRDIEDDADVRKEIGRLLGIELKSRRDLLKGQADDVIKKLEETGPPPPEEDQIPPVEDPPEEQS
jgi:hypothetical protein